MLFLESQTEVKKKNSKSKSKRKGIFKYCEEIDDEEKQFWEDMIRKYLQPLESNEQEKQRVQEELIELRNKIFLGFFVINAIFVTMVFVLTQVNKNQGTLQIKLPCRAENASIEPISVAFTLTFGILLLIQFFGMLYHRFSTFAHIIVTTGFQTDSVLKKKPTSVNESGQKGTPEMTIGKEKTSSKRMASPTPGQLLRSITHNKIFLRSSFDQKRKEIDDQIQMEVATKTIDNNYESADRIINIRRIVYGEHISSARS